LAPSDCSWQPWEFRISAEGAELLASDSPIADSLDPEGRETLISCGTALYYFRLALRRCGCLGRTEMFPDLARPRLVAKVHVGVLGERDAAERRLFEAMTTPRSTPIGRTVEDLLPGLLSGAVARGRGWLEVPCSENSQQRLHELTGVLPPPPVSEVRFRQNDWTRVRGAETSGLAVSAILQRFSRWRRPVITDRLRPATRTVANSTEFSSSDPVFAVLKTKTDEPHGWLAVGQTQAWLILQARVLGLSCSLFNQALRQAEIRSELRVGIGHKGFVQGIARFGAIHPASINTPQVLEAATTTANSGPRRINA